MPVAHGVVFLSSMSIYDLRTLFPYNGYEFSLPSGSWICRLAEVSDSRPEADRLSWYLVFEPVRDARAPVRKLEIVTTPSQATSHGFGADAEDRLKKWLASNQESGREEWL